MVFEPFGHLGLCSHFPPPPPPPPPPLLERSRDSGPGGVFGRFAYGDFSQPSGYKCKFMNQLDMYSAVLLCSIKNPT